MSEIATYKEILQGFDAREADQDFATTWEQARKDRFLLKQDIFKPLSTDVRVWNTVLPVKSKSDLLGAMLGTHLWLSFAEINERLHELEPDLLRPYWLIAVTRWVEENEVADFYPVEWPENHERWLFLGYDISDWVHLSGLTNCGYRADEIDALKQDWAAKLNQYHLFTDLQTAFAFKALTDRRVREHSLFSVYGLYLIEKHDSGHTSA